MSVQFSGGNQIGYHEGVAVLGSEDTIEKTKKSDTKVSEKSHRERAEDTMSMPSTVKSLSARQSFVTHEGAKAENDEQVARLGEKDSEKDEYRKTIDELSLSKSLRQNAIEDILFAGITTIFGTNQRGLRKRKRPVKLRGKKVIKPGMKLPEPVFEEPVEDSPIKKKSDLVLLLRYLRRYRHHLQLIASGIFIGSLFPSAELSILAALALCGLMLAKQSLGR